MNLEYETDRLLLKVLRAEEAQNVLQFYLDNKDFFEKYEPDRPENFYTETHQKAILLHEYNTTIKLTAVRFYVYRKEQPQQIIGTISFRNITRSIFQSCEVGYKFDERFLHQGYALEAMEMGLMIMFEDQKLHRIEANVMPENTSSIHLLETLGFESEGIARQSTLIHGKWEDHLRYSLILS